MTNYKVTKFNKISGSLTVVFDEKMAPLNIDIPLNDDGNYIMGDELDLYIKGFIPTWHLERINKISAGIPNESDIEALVEQSTEASLEEPLPTDAPTIADEWQQQEVEKQIAKTLIKFGVLTEDPTE